METREEQVQAILEIQQQSLKEIASIVDKLIDKMDQLEKRLPASESEKSINPLKVTHI